MHYCRVICLVSSTDQIYHLRASRLGDKFDRSMTLGKLLGNNALLFISRRGDKFDRSMTRGKLLSNNALLFIFISYVEVSFYIYTYSNFLRIINIYNCGDYEIITINYLYIISWNERKISYHFVSVVLIDFYPSKIKYHLSASWL